MTLENLDTQKLWEKCAEFHGHVCGGLAIGYKAALYAIELLDLSFSEDEEVVTITENDACGVDAIQVILGTSVGKGNLLFHMTGKQAFSFYNRKTNKSVRLVLKPRDKNMSREDSLKYFMENDYKDLFDVKETTIEIPEHARIFESYICEKCGENTASKFIRIEEGKKLCLDCYDPYSRFNV